MADEPTKTTTAAQRFRVERNRSVALAKRDAKVAEITKELVSCVASRAAADVQLEKVCTSEIAKIQAALDVEVTQRELQDDNIITALNQYTNKLQSSLNIINSTNA